MTSLVCGLQRRWCQISIIMWFRNNINSINNSIIHTVVVNACAYARDMRRCIANILRTIARGSHELASFFCNVLFFHEGFADVSSSFLIDGQWGFYTLRRRRE